MLETEQEPAHIQPRNAASPLSDPILHTALSSSHPNGPNSSPSPSLPIPRALQHEKTTNTTGSTPSHQDTQLYCIALHLVGSSLGCSVWSRGGAGALLLVGSVESRRQQAGTYDVGGRGRRLYYPFRGLGARAMDCDDSVALDMDIAPWGGQEYMVPTSYGHISVTVCGDQDKPALITYSDVGLNYLSCFEGLFSCLEASSVLFHNFCIFHIDPPGHEIGAPDSVSQEPSPSVDDLADQVAEVLDYFGLEEVIGLGVTGGAYILSLFACKHPDRALGLILVSPLARAPSWTEWLHNQAMISLLYFCGMTGFVKERLFQRYFSLEVRDAAISEDGADALTTIRRYMDDRRSKNVLRYLQALHQRRDLTENLKKMKCRTLILVGEQSPFHREAVHISNAMNRRYNALIEVEGCGSLVTEERPQAMLVPIELFLTGYAFYQRPLLSLTSSPKSPLSPPCMPAELLSSESLGLKLKPIKTRVSS